MDDTVEGRPVVAILVDAETAALRARRPSLAAEHAVLSVSAPLRPAVASETFRRRSPVARLGHLGEIMLARRLDSSMLLSGTS